MVIVQFFNTRIQKIIQIHNLYVINLKNISPAPDVLVMICINIIYNTNINKTFLLIFKISRFIRRTIFNIIRSEFYTTCFIRFTVFCTITWHQSKLSYNFLYIHLWFFCGACQSVYKLVFRTSYYSEQLSRMLVC